MFTAYLWIVGILIFIDIVKWFNTEDRLLIRKPTFFDMLISSLVINIIVGIVLLTAYKFFMWLFA